MSREREARLRRLVRLERMKQRDAENRLADCERRRRQVDRHDEMLAGTLAEEIASLRDRAGPGQSVEDLKLAHRYLNTVSETLGRVRRERAEIEREYQASRERWMRQKRRGDAIDELADEANRRAARAGQAEEDLTSDDLSHTESKD